MSGLHDVEFSWNFRIVSFPLAFPRESQQAARRLEVHKLSPVTLLDAMRRWQYFTQWNAAGNFSLHSLQLDNNIPHEILIFDSLTTTHKWYPTLVFLFSENVKQDFPMQSSRIDGVLDDIFNKNSNGNGFSLSLNPPLLHFQSFSCVMSNIHSRFRSKMKSSSTRILNKLHRETRTQTSRVNYRNWVKVWVFVLFPWGRRKVNNLAEMWHVRGRWSGNEFICNNVWTTSHFQ